MRWDGRPVLVALGPAFFLYAIAVREALLGQGVLMGRSSRVEHYLGSGALEGPFIPEGRRDRRKGALRSASILQPEPWDK